MQPENKILLK